jgi:uncharacterized protein
MINVRCPICERRMQGEGPSEWPAWPFCSSRCRLIDLGRWLGESYRVPDAAADAPPAVPDDNDDSPKTAVPSAAPNRDEA